MKIRRMCKELIAVWKKYIGIPVFLLLLGRHVVQQLLVDPLIRRLL